MRKKDLHPRTELINKKQKNQAKQARNDALSWLTKKFPQAFDTETQIRPLKCKIMVDILAYADEAAIAGISKSKLREAIVVFTRRMDYLACLKAKEMRIDLDGNVVASVTDEEASLAALKIKKRVEKSVKSARKLGSASKATSTFTRCNEQRGSNTSYHGFSHANEEQQTPHSNARAPSIHVKRKYDPAAVAKLRAKLGIGLAKQELNEET